MTKIIHITDTHLVTPGEPLYGLDPYARLVACVDDILEHHTDAECCVITGDLTHRGEASGYAALREQLDRLPFPSFPLMGNHDLRSVFTGAFPERLRDENGFVQGRFDVGDASLLMLDTLDEGQHGGLYCEARRAWLARELDRLGERPAYLFMHHPPFDIGIASLDNIGMANPEAFLALVGGRKNIRHLFFGHVHRPVCGSWHGIPYSTMRGLNHQVPFDMHTVFPVRQSHEPPAYAVVLLAQDQVTVHFHDYLDKSWLEDDEDDGGESRM
ncbi:MULTISPECIES: phosphodiesterase [Pandoraea]|uniref:phosphodiesterase n=1 Tax=Pandoraea TaxID=93217 RepID=UPI001F5DFFBE|nr:MULTISPECIES: phosphodiesterase [Pandoraea]MCI3204276.1 phosphodiesterase [Pandoraea sp. LA3]MDN4582302.1 phosphodiesterase [Pandoraea capi]